MTQNNKPLTVYKASAGSGKTFTLAIEYITLLISNPKSYENILAVTFTNKATEEMKTRIISQLYGISQQLPDSKDYLEKIVNKTGMSKTDVEKRAKIALASLIHNYNSFRVQTIDAFFQGILRNLARELDLTANLRVDLNDDNVEENAVEEMVEDLESGDKLLGWIREYIDSNMNEDRSWNVLPEIKKFGKNIFRDFYKQNSKELDKLMKDEKFFVSYTKRLQQTKDDCKKEITSKAYAIISELENHSLNDYEYISYGSRGSVLSYVNKVYAGTFNGESSTKRIQDCINDPKKWAKKKTGREAELTALAESRLCEMLKDLEDTRQRLWKDYQSAKLTLLHLNQLRLLHAIAEAVDNINKDNNRFQLSNTQSLLNSLIKDSDSPFIFEKTGTLLKHIMIDEFQDTSTVQWENFKKLLDNCMAQSGSHNLIVGDVKQSIYRWRSGDWKLLNNINEQFNESEMNITTLDTNYRSEQKIVNFNNIFFEKARDHTVTELQSDGIDGYEQLKKAYGADDDSKKTDNTSNDSLKQKSNKKNDKGCVEITLFPNEDYRDNIMQNLLNKIDEMLDAGISENDIAILVRSNTDIQAIAELFMKERPGIKIVSDEAFRLDASVAVNIIIHALRTLVSPDDKLANAKLVKLYDRLVVKRDTSDIGLFVTSDEDHLLPEAFTDKKDRLVAMPLAELVDYIYMVFGLAGLKEQSAYVCAFYDCLGEYLQDNPSDIDAFLREWDENLHKKTITSDETNGIRIISIHKSKGLEFDNVIIPLCDWELERGNTIWCGKKTVAPYNELPIVPIDFSKSSMKGTVYENDYKEEHLQNVVDNMNLLYVAFTRAGKNLVVTGKRMSADRRKKKDVSITSSNRSEIIEEVLEDIAESLENSVIEGLEDTKSPLTFSYGTLLVPDNNASKTKAESQNVFLIPAMPYKTNVETFDNPVEFRQSNKSKDFTSGEDETPTLSYVKTGNLLHMIFSSIRTADDIEPALRSLETEGVIYDDTITSDDIRSRIDKAFADSRVQEWFSGKWKLYNECSILTKDKDGNMVEYRPDRVMTDGKQTVVVDFKFGKPHKEYIQQVAGYMTLLSEMGHKNVKGYLWYVLRNEITEI